MNKKNFIQTDKNLKKNIKNFQSWKEKENIFKKWVGVICPIDESTLNHFTKRAINRYLKQNKLEIDDINPEHVLKIKEDKLLQERYKFHERKKIMLSKKEMLTKKVKSIFREKINKLETEELEVLYNFLKKYH